MALVGGATRMPSLQAFISKLTGLPLKVCISKPAICPVSLNMRCDTVEAV